MDAEYVAYVEGVIRTKDDLTHYMKATSYQKARADALEGAASRFLDAWYEFEGSEGNLADILGEYVDHLANAVEASKGCDCHPNPSGDHTEDCRQSGAMSDG